MKIAFVRLFCLAAFHFVAAASSAAWMNSSMSWSPDSRWLAYTSLDGPAEPLPHGWLLGAAAAHIDSPSGRVDTRKVPARPAVYRIWAIDQNSGANVLIEESRWPLSAPAWGPLGRSLAYSRFVPESGGAAGESQTGRLEVIVQRSLDEKKVVWTSPEFVLDEETRAALPGHRSAWSAAGQFLAVPRPGRVPSIDIIRMDTGKRVHILDHGILPAWSPTGAMCAYIRRGIGNHSLEVVGPRGQGFSEPRELIATGPVTTAPFWDTDGRSILVVAEMTTSRSREFELVRCALDASEPAELMKLVPDPVRRLAKLRGVTIDFDKEAEVSYHSADLENRESELVWTLVKEPRTRRQFHPLDPSLRIAAVSISPNGRTVAVRFGDPDALSHPALYDGEAEQTRLLVPDDDARRAWMKILTTTALRVLRNSLPPVVVEGQTFERATVLPLPNELAGQANVSARLGRIALLGEALLPARGKPDEAAAADSDDESRLLFDYLRGDLQAAAADLDALDRQTTDFDHRFTILSIRALIRWGQGDQDQARQIISYLVANTGTSTLRVEDTPLGPVFEKIATPAQAWTAFLSARASATQSQREATPAPENVDPFDLLTAPGLQRLLELPDFPRMQPGGADGPFAPVPAPELDKPARP